MDARESRVMADIKLGLIKVGYVRNHVVVAPKELGRQRFRIAYVHVRRKVAIEVGRANPRRDALLRLCGWKVFRIERSTGRVSIARKPRKTGSAYGP